MSPLADPRPAAIRLPRAPWDPDTNPNGMFTDAHLVMAGLAEPVAAGPIHTMWERVDLRAFRGYENRPAAGQIWDHRQGDMVDVYFTCVQRGYVTAYAYLGTDWSGDGSGSTRINYVYCEHLNGTGTGDEGEFECDDCGHRYRWTA